ncbi:Aspartate/glutamate/uridylate kinase, partial [Penicillium herquei]
GGHFVSQFPTAQRSRAQTNRAIITQLPSLIDSKHHIQHYLQRFRPSRVMLWLRVGLFPAIVYGELGVYLDLDISSGSTLKGPANQSNHLRCIRTINHLLSALLRDQEGNVTGFIPEAIESRVRVKSVPIVGSPSSPEQIIHNRAFVFPRTSFPSSSSHLETWAPSSTTTSVENAHRDEPISRLALFSISHPDWQNSVAEQFCNWIREDHGSLWGSLANTDQSLSWWLSRSSGFRTR